MPVIWYSAVAHVRASCEAYGCGRAEVANREAFFARPPISLHIQRVEVLRGVQCETETC